MSVIYSTNTQLFLKELTKIHQTTQLKSDQAKRGKSRKAAPKMYTSDTSKFEPIEENREHLIRTLMPMVVKIAKGICSKFGQQIEYDDCISAGMQGAVMATDIYIKKSKDEEQPAKLSTYAHFWIVKYVNEHCYGVNTILSHGPTQWSTASKNYVMSGNQTYKDEGRATEFFEIANEPALMTQPIEQDDLTDAASQISEQLFDGLDQFDKSVIFLSYGIGAADSQMLQPAQVAKRLGTSTALVNRSLTKSLTLMRESIDQEKIPRVMMILRSADLTKIPHWNL